jgi:cytoskeletal protein CcmA (bactofilin family)
MWKIRQVEAQPATVPPEPPRQAPAILTLEANSRAALLTSHQSVIGKGLVVMGEIAGAESPESLFIEGTVEGSINLPSSLVTVGHGGLVITGIVARNIVVCGTITGNVTASDRLEIRAGGSLTGDALAPRITIEDGAFIVGSVLVAKDVEELAAVVKKPPVEAEPRRAILIRPEIEIQSSVMVPALRSA